MLKTCLKHVEEAVVGGVSSVFGAVHWAVDVVSDPYPLVVYFATLPIRLFVRVLSSPLVAVAVGRRSLSQFIRTIQYLVSVLRNTCKSLLIEYPQMLSLPGTPNSVNIQELADVLAGLDDLDFEDSQQTFNDLEYGNSVPEKQNVNVSVITKTINALQFNRSSEDFVEQSKYDSDHENFDLYFKRQDSRQTLRDFNNDRDSTVQSIVDAIADDSLSTLQSLLDAVEEVDEEDVAPAESASQRDDSSISGINLHSSLAKKEESDAAKLLFTMKICAEA